MLARVRSGHSVRHRADDVFVEVDVAPGLPSFITVGLPDSAVRESRDRVRAALKNCGYDIPPTHITINLAPADIKKEGSGFDLPMALGIVGAYGGLTAKEIPDYVFVGELSLDGGIRGVRGALPIAIAARGKKISHLVVPEINAREAAVVSGVGVYPVRSLMDVVGLVNGKDGIPPVHGFWSLSIYNEHHFFVANPINRFSVGTKNKDLKYNADGSLTIYVQSEEPNDAVQRANWLPAPQGDFSLYVRAYWPKPAVTDGTWTPPAVEKAK